MSAQSLYSTTGPICPHCMHRHRADEPFYFDEDMVVMDCEACDRGFNVRVFTQTSWTTEAPARSDEGGQP